MRRDQWLKLPNAVERGTATVETVPLEVLPRGGRVIVNWADDSTVSDPRFHVTPVDGGDTPVKYRYMAATGNENYALYSEQGVVRDSGEAHSPLTLVDDSSKETLQIRPAQSGGGGGAASTTGGGGGTYQNPNTPRPLSIMPVIDPKLIVVVVLGTLGAGVAYSRRAGSTTNATPLYERPSVALAAVMAVVLAVLLISPTTIVGPLRGALGATLPLLGIVAAGGVAFALYSKFGGSGGSKGSKGSCGWFK